MTQLQYIGARYVPVWYHNSLDDTSNWEVNVEYEPLTFVTSLNNHLYISKKTVPDNIGTPADNTEYWLDMGVFTGQSTEGLQEQIDQLVEDLGDTNAALGLLDTKVDNNFDFITKKKIVMITDSYGNRTDANGDTVGDVLTAKGADIVYYRAISGGGFLGSGATDPLTYIDEYTGDHDKITDVYFCMSANDNQGTWGDIATAVANAVQVTKTSYPNARIVIVPWGVSFVSIGWAQVLLDDTIKGYIQGANTSGAIIAENAQYILRNTAYLDVDLIHPNQSGVDLLATYVFGHILGNKIDVYHTMSSSMTVAAGSGISNFNGSSIMMYRHNGEVTMTCLNAGGLFGNFDHTQEVATFTANPGFTINGTLFSRPQTISDKYYTVAGKCRDVSANAYTAAFLKFSIYDGSKIRIFINSGSMGAINRFDSNQNSVTFFD